MTRLERDGAVAVVTLDRPGRRNALDRASLAELLDVLAELGDHADPQRRPRAVVLTGAPPAFCAGADLEGVDDRGVLSMLRAVLRGLAALRVPVVGAIDGAALGGGLQLAMACDLRVATPTSVFGIPAAKLGLTVDRGAIGLLVRELGWPTARLMLLAAETRSGEQLAALGVVHRLGGLDVALTWAAELATLAPLTLAAHKLALAAGASAGEDAELADVADAANAAAAADAAAWASADAAEGRSAFLERRPARFDER